MTTYLTRDKENDLVSAIKEAAAKIDYNKPMDPEGVLAECLMKRGFTEDFAKTATDTLNKSYSVNYMENHDEDTRGSDHPLLDYNKVVVKMAPENSPVDVTNWTPVESNITVSVNQVVPKAASVSAPVTQPKRYTPYGYMCHLVQGLSKVAEAYDGYRRDTDAAEVHIKQLIKDASDHRDKFDPYTIDCIFDQNHNGINTFMECMGLSRQKSDTPIMGTKKAHTVRVVPDNPTSNMVYSMFNMAQDVSEAKVQVEELHKYACAHKEALGRILSWYDNESISGGFSKQSRDADTDNVKTVADIVTLGLTAAPSVAMGTYSGALKGLGEVGSSVQDMINATREPESLSKVLDADFLKEDRRVKNLEAWADVASDPGLAQYPMTELYPVTMKLLGGNSSYERPDASPMLIDMVSQIMAQGGRMGLGLRGSQEKIMADIAKARGQYLSGTPSESARGVLTGRKVEVPGTVNIMRPAAGMSEAFDLVPAIVEGLRTGVKNTSDLFVNKQTLEDELRDIKTRQDLAKERTKEIESNKLEKDTEEAKRIAESRKIEWIDALAKDPKLLQAAAANPTQLRQAFDKYPDLVTNSDSRKILLDFPGSINYPGLVDSMMRDTRVRDILYANKDKANRILSEHPGAVKELMEHYPAEYMMENLA